MPTFEPPTLKQRQPGDRLFSRYGVQVGQSVVKKNGHYVTDPYPWIGDLQGLTDGVDYFLGGHVYVISSAVATALQADGYTTS